MKSFVLFLGLAFFCFDGGAQTLSGKILNQSGEPLQGISISVDNSFTGTTSQSDGGYLLRFPKAGSYTVSVQGLGFITQTKSISLAENETLSQDFSLETSWNALKDITITAGRKAEVVDRTPASVQVIQLRDIERQQLVSPNINNILAHSVPSLGLGTNTTSNTGQTLRGRNPLILIDGIPQSTPLRAGGRDMRTIDPAIIIQ